MLVAVTILWFIVTIGGIAILGYWGWKNQKDVKGLESWLEQSDIKLEYVYGEVQGLHKNRTWAGQEIAKLQTEMEKMKVDMRNLNYKVNWTDKTKPESTIDQLFAWIEAESRIKMIMDYFNLEIQPGKTEPPKLVKKKK